MRPINPEEQLVLVAGIEVVADGTLGLAANPLVADKKVSTRAETHEDVIVEIPERNNFLQAELQNGLMSE